ncbi:MAG: hypothetical protein QM586_01140 [Xenophilus sp.]
MTAAPPPSPAFRPACAGAWAWLLALTLVLASSLGQIHRVLHDHPAHAAAAGQAAGTPAQADKEVHGLLALFAGHHDGDLQCRLYDQAAHGSALPSVAAVLLPVVLPTAVFDFMQGEALARWVLLFDARGPPAAR